MRQQKQTTDVRAKQNTIIVAYTLFKRENETENAPM